MNDFKKTKAQLITEIEELRQKLSDENYILGTIQDITERIHAEMALNREKIFTEKILNIQPYTFFVFDAKTGKALRWNKVFEEVSGYSSKEIAQMKVPDSYYSSGDLKKTEKFIKNIFKGGYGKIELDLICKNGNKIPTEYAVSVLENDNGNPSYLIAIGRDITERKQAKRSLYNDKLISEEYINSLPGLFYVFDENRFVKWNKQFAKVSGYRSEELSKMYATDFFEGQDKVIISKKMQEVFKNGSAEAEAQFVTKEGKRIPYYFSGMRKIFDGKLYLVGLGIDISKVKQAEKLKLESEEKLRNIVENSTNLFYSHTPDHKLTYMSPQSIDFLQCKPKEAMIRWTEFTTDNPINNIGYNNTVKAIKTGKRQPPFELELIGKKGKIINVEVNEAPVTKNGKVIGIVGSLTNITERKQAESKIQESEERYRAVVEQSRECIFLSDIDSKKILEANPSMLKLLGYSKKEISQLSIFQIIANNRKSVLKNIKALKKHGYKFIGERKYFRKDRSIVDVEVSVSLISYQNKKVMCVVSRDITDRKQIESALQESEEKYRLIVENAHDGIEITQNDKIIFANSCFADMLGCTIDELKNSSFSDHFTEQATKELFEREKKRKNGLSVANQYETTFKKKDGTVFDVDVKYEIIQYKDKPATFAIIRDITDRKKAEAELKRRLDYEQLINEISSFAIRVENLKNFLEKSIILLGKTLDVSRIYIFEYDKDADILNKTFEWTGKNVSPQIDNLKNIPANKLSWWMHNLQNNDIINYSDISLIPDKNVQTILKQQNIKSILVVPLFVSGMLCGFIGFDECRKNRIWPQADVLVLLSASRILAGVIERKQADFTLKTNEERLDLAMSVANDGMWDWDLVDNTTYFDPRYYIMAGYKPNEFPANFDEWAKRVHPEDFPNTEKEVYSYLEGKIPEFDVEFRFKRKDDSWIWIRARGKIVERKKDGTPLRMVGTHADITERKNAEVALSESEKKFRNLIEQSNDAIYLLLEDKFELINTRFSEQFGYTLKECQKDDFNFRQLIAPKSLSMIEHRVERTKKGEKLDPLYEFTAVTKDGTEVECEVSTSYIEYQGKTAVQGIIRDITGRKKAQEEKSNLEKQLRRAQKLETIGTLAGGIAHDFNNILAPIMGYTDMALMNMDKTNPLYDDLQHVLKGAHRAKESVEQILLFSKQGEKEQQPQILQDLVSEALKLLRPSIPTTIEIRQMIDQNCNKVLADATQMHQVIINLCTNAWQAMEQTGGTLTIQLNQVTIDETIKNLYPNLSESEYIKLSVIDTGTGMDDETLDRIFEPFFSTKTVDKGTGLGLSVVHGIIKNHKGDIQVYSEKNKGSEFHVYLPVLTTEEDQSDMKNYTVLKGNEQLLIIDDELEIGNLVKKMLEKFGYKSHVFQNGIEALKSFKQDPEKFDLLISDLTMPQLTGLDLADQFHKIKPGLPILIMTGFGDNITSSTQERYGISQVIGKPIIINELTSVVRSILDEKN